MRHGIRLVACDAADDSSATSQPWSSVKQLDLSSYRIMHKDSFSHRNLKTYIVAVHVTGSRACLAAEEEMAKLANGLRNEPQIVCASLNALESREHFSFCTSVLHVKSYPTILLYPEGSPGLLRYGGDEVTAKGLVEALNGSFRATGNSRRVTLDLEESAQGSRLLTRSIESERMSMAEAAASLKSEASSYWSPGKSLFWGFVLFFAISSFVWDQWLEDWVAMRQLEARQKARKMGKDFDEATTEEDLMNMTYLDANRVILKKLQRGGQEDPEGKKGLV